MTTAINTGWIPSDDGFAARLALVRNRMGWNAKEAALACGLPPQSWRNWEAGVRPHDHAQVCRAIAAHTGANIEWLALGPGGAVTPSSSWSQDPFGLVAEAA